MAQTEIAPRAEIAAEMGVSLSDLDSFVNCLRVWTDKGLSLEEAVERHLEQMQRMANNAWVLACSPDMRALAVKWFYPAA
jgi:hypothetical protein